MKNARKFLTIALAITALIHCSCRGTAASGSGATSGAAKSSRDDAFFPIMCWEIPPRCDQFDDPDHGLQSLADCGFTVAGFARPHQLAECERLGLRAIVSREKGPVRWETMSDEQIDANVRKMVDGVRGKPGSDAIIGYFITDEPGVHKFPALAKAAAAVERHAPGKLAYMNLFPDYATLGAPNLSQLGTTSYDEYLDRFVGEVRPKLISYDNYRVQFSNDLQKADVAASYFRNLMSVRRKSIESDLPFWVIVTSNQIRPYTPVPSPANLLMQAYTTLAAGARGLTWYTYYSGKYGYAPIDMAGRRTASWSYLKMVNDQVKVVGPALLKLRSTGVYFTTPPPVDGLPQLPGKLVQSVESPAPVMVGEFSGPNDEAWVMLVNLSLRDSAKLKPTFTRAGTKPHAVSPVDGSLLPLESDNAVWLPAGQGVLIKLP